MSEKKTERIQDEDAVTQVDPFVTNVNNFILAICIII